MTSTQRSLGTIIAVLALAGCKAEPSDLERHAERCASNCSAAQRECAADSEFADPWALACEVACNLDYHDQAHPFDACMANATTCDDKAACVDGGPIAGDTDTGVVTDDDDDDATSTTGVAETGEGSSGAGSGSSTGSASETGTIEGHACCDVSGAPCVDAEVQACVCPHMPGCCGGVWGEVCASVAVANGCIPDGCATLDGWNEWNCTCSTYDVYCPDEPFVSQLIFGTDACGQTQSDALAISAAACEQGDGSCTVGVGSCDCECTDDGTSCGPVE